jgi:hypothetical protein
LFLTFSIPEHAFLCSDLVAHARLLQTCSLQIRNDVGHKLAMIETEPDMTFTLFGINEQLPLNYRLATVQEVQNHRDALFEAMPSWEIANLADGSVQGALYGGSVR